MLNLGEYTACAGVFLRFLYPHKLFLKDYHAVFYCGNVALDQYSLFGVFDGHNGDAVSKHASSNLVDFVIDEFLLVLEDGKVLNCEEIESAITEAFAEFDREMRIDQQFQIGGSTAVLFIFTPKSIFTVHLGDSRGIIVGKKETKQNVKSPEEFMQDTNFFEILHETVDHKPENEDERLRIESLGGEVKENRIFGRLAMSRAFGDFIYKNAKDPENINLIRHESEQLVSCVPTVNSLSREKDFSFGVLASDGVFDVVDNQDLVDYLGYRLFSMETLDTVAIISDLFEACVLKDSKDNMTAILIINKDFIKNQFEESFFKVFRNYELNYVENIKSRIIQICNSASFETFELVKSKNKRDLEKFIVPGLLHDGRKLLIEQLFETYRPTLPKLRYFTETELQEWKID